MKWSKRWFTKITIRLQRSRGGAKVAIGDLNFYQKPCPTLQRVKHDASEHGLHPETSRIAPLHTTIDNTYLWNAQGLQLSPTVARAPPLHPHPTLFLVVSVLRLQLEPAHRTSAVQLKPLPHALCTHSSRCRRVVTRVFRCVCGVRTEPSGHRAEGDRGAGGKERQLPTNINNH